MRDPWADKRVLEFFLHLPIDQLFRDGWTKYLARSTFAPDLEDFVPWRNDKEHHGWMVLDRLMCDSGEFIDQTMNEDLGLIEAYIDRAAALRIHARYRDSNDSMTGEQVFSLMTLILWMKRLSGSQA